MILAEQEAEQKRLLELEQLKLDEERKRFKEKRRNDELSRSKVEQAKQNKKKRKRTFNIPSNGFSVIYFFLHI